MLKKFKKLKCKLKGKFTERTVSLAFRLKFPSSYKILTELNIPDKYGRVHIDVCVVSRYGIFVIDIIDMNGTVIIDLKSKYWIQEYNGKTYRFRNALHKMYRARKAIEELLGLEPGTVHEFVFFAGDGKIISTNAKNKFPDKVFTHGISAHIKETFKKEVFSEQEVERIYTFLKEFK